MDTYEIIKEQTIERNFAIVLFNSFIKQEFDFIFFIITLIVFLIIIIHKN